MQFDSPRQVARLCVSQHSNALNAVPAFAVQWKAEPADGDSGAWTTAWEAALKPGYHCTAMPATFETPADLQAAVDAWVLDPTAAEFEHGHISGWDVSRVGHLANLFGAKQAFNDDIGGWDTSPSRAKKAPSARLAFDRYIGGWDRAR